MLLLVNSNKVTQTWSTAEELIWEHRRPLRIVKFRASGLASRHFK